MSRFRVLIIAAVAFGLGIGAGTLGILYGTGGLSAPSVDVADLAPTLSLDQPTPTPNMVAQLQNDLATANAQIALLSTQVANAEALPAATVAPTEPPVAEAEATPERLLFRIDDEQSEVRFIISESFFGNTIDVIGATDNVAGDIIVNLANPSASQIGTIAINARTIKTDNEFRDQSIRGQILETSDYEVIEFVPTSLIALSTDPVAVGETVTFQIEGDLTIKTVTQSVTFETTVEAVSLGEISGLASTEVAYADFGIEVKPPPDIADVGETARLEIEFIALVVDEPT